MKLDKSLKIVLCIAGLFLLVSSSNAVAEQDTFGLKTYTTALTFNKTLDHPINPVHLLPGQAITPWGHIVNTSDYKYSKMEYSWKSIDR